MFLKINIVCKIVLLDFVHHVNYKSSNYNVSEAGFCFRLQVKMGERGQKDYRLGPLVELASDL
jgi:hypothetical protein